jgi:putative spermidine/putrescine transport system permease protein
MALAPYATPVERAWYYTFRVLCALVLLFLIAPILVIMPLSLNSEPYFTYPLPALSLRWYEDFFTSERWQTALKNSVFVACVTTMLATALGTVAALGLSRANLPLRAVIMGLLISPMVVPVVITAVGLYFFYSWAGLNNSYIGLILAHTALATPFVVITVTATLTGFDKSLAHASASLGAPPRTTFFRVIVPLILPGVISGALFAFVTSFDEVVIALFLTGPAERTLPRQMFNGIRENISPVIAAAASLLILLSVLLLTALELLRRRNERLRGIRP